MKKYKILFVAGTFDTELKNPDQEKTGTYGVLSPDDAFDIDMTIERHSSKQTYGKQSGLATKVIKELIPYASILKFANGGYYPDLEQLLNEAKDFDLVFWWANVANDLPKIRNIKEAAPHVMLITSKRNDNNKYSFMELNQRALASKSNLVFEFSKIQPIVSPSLTQNTIFNIRVFDPLGCSWYDGTNIHDCIQNAMDRLNFISSITRQKTTKIDTDNGLVLKWYFDCFEQQQIQSEKQIAIPDEQEFINLVKEYAEVFHAIMKPAPNVTRFLGNCSMKPQPPQVGRCSKGMPSFRKDGFVFVSRRNVDKEYLTLEHFVPTYLQDNEVYYCGDYKPSVDTPIQLRLYDKLPNIHYMIHAHVYAKEGIFTTYPIPCGAIEEVDEIINTIQKEYGTLNGTRYILNLKGHGSIIMGETINDIKNIEYYGRTLPESF